MLPWKALLAVVAILVAPAARAEIILDDFVDSAWADTGPTYEDTIETTGVGDLNATRGLRIAGTTAINHPPTATLDANITTPGSLTADLDVVGGTISGDSPFFAFQFNYDFESADLTEGGVNDAFIFDFAGIGGTEPPYRFGLLLDDEPPGGLYFAQITDFASFPPAGTSFTAAIPFSNFTLRNGAPGLPDFSQVEVLRFDVYFIRPNLDIQWSAELTSIRVGVIPVPELPTRMLSQLGLLVGVTLLGLRSRLYQFFPRRLISWHAVAP